MQPILQHQIERLVPLRASDVCFDYRIIARAPVSNTLKVRLIIAKRATIDRGLALARAAGLNPKLVIAADADDEPGVRRGRTPLVLSQPGRAERGWFRSAAGRSGRYRWRSVGEQQASMAATPVAAGA